MSSLPEVALEEICRSDGDEADDLDIDTVSCQWRHLKCLIGHL